MHFYMCYQALLGATAHASVDENESGFFESDSECASDSDVASLIKPLTLVTLEDALDDFTEGAQMPAASDEDPLADFPVGMEPPTEASSPVRLWAVVVEAGNGFTEQLQDPECFVSHRHHCSRFKSEFQVTGCSMPGVNTDLVDRLHIPIPSAPCASAAGYSICDVALSLERLDLGSSHDDGDSLAFGG